MLAGFLLINHHSSGAGGEYKRLRGFGSVKRLRECGLTKSSIVLSRQVTQTLYNPPSKRNLLPMLAGFLLINHHSSGAGGEYKRLRGFGKFKGLRSYELTNASIVLSRQVTQYSYNSSSKRNYLPMLAGFCYSPTPMCLLKFPTIFSPSDIIRNA